MELVATGRTADVFDVGPGRVVKLDRPEWNGLSHYEAGIVRAAHDAGLPVPEVFETVVIEGRHGVVPERLDGPTLSDVIAASCDLEKLAAQFVELYCRLHEVDLSGLPALVTRLRDELRRSGLSADLRAELDELLTELASGVNDQLCHFDLHPGNIIVTSSRWVVIDWLTAAAGPPAADFARSLLLRADSTEPGMASFLAYVRQDGKRRRSIDEHDLGSWTRVVAGARLAEGFDGSYAAWLTAVASRQRTP